jgi:tRNA threonylcarbamoyladenosine biosynthesis protein TsaE
MEKIRKVDLPLLAQRVLDVLPQTGERAAVVALTGALGAGKTTFVQALGSALRVEAPIQSPTYVLMKTYPISFGRFKTLIHIDAYRLEQPDEFSVLKPEAFLQNPHALVVCEWPERLGGKLPKPDVSITFSSESADADERFVEMR